MRKSALVLVVVLSTAVQMYAADALVGTWVFNPASAKSTQSNALKSRTDIVEAQADGSLKVTRTETRGNGQTQKGSYPVRFDGKEYPVQGNLDYDTISAKRIDANSYEARVTKKGGPYNQLSRTTVSADGKKRTVVSKGTDSAGKPSESTYTYDRK